jgi:hypothetical protein
MSATVNNNQQKTTAETRQTHNRISEIGEICGST